MSGECGEDTPWRLKTTDERKLIQLNSLVGVVYCDQECHNETTWSSNTLVYLSSIFCSFEYC